MASSLRELVVSVTADTRRYQAQMQQASQSTGQVFRSVQQGAPSAARAWDSQTEAARHHATAIEASKQAMTRYMGVAAGAFSVGKLVGMADEWNQLNARVRLATGSTQEFEMAQERLGEIASRTYRRYSEAAEQFAQTIRPMQELGFTTAQTLDSAEALGLALVAGGANAQKGAAASDAWAKSMVQGRIAGDQFQTLMLGTPRVVQALSDALGKSTGELQEMASSGQLLASVVVPALISQMGQLRKESDALPVSVQDASNRLVDGLQKWAGSADKATGATKILIGGMELLGNNIETVANLAAGGAIGVLGSKIAMVGVDAVKAGQGMLQARDAQVALTAARVVDARESVVAAAIRAREAAEQKAFYADMKLNAVGKTELTYATTRYERAAERAAMATQAQRASVQSLTAAETAATAATNRLTMAKTAMLGVVGGPTGLAITIGLAAVGMLTLGSSSASAQSDLQSLNGTLDETIAKFRVMNAEQRAGALLTLSREVAEAEREVNAALDRLLTAPRGTIGGGAWEQARDGVQRAREEFAAAAIDADTLSAKAGNLAREMLENGNASERLGEEYVGLLEKLANAARTADEARGKMSSLTGENQNLERSARGAAGGLMEQAGALDTVGQAADAAKRKIQGALVSLPGQIARMGRSPVEAAQMDVDDWIAGLEAKGKPYLEIETARDQGRNYVGMVEQQTKVQHALDASAKAARAYASAVKAATKEQSDAEKAAQRMLEHYEDMAAAQAREIALHGEVGRAAAMAYDTATGSLIGFTEAQKAGLIEGAKWLDWLDEMAALDDVWDGIASEQKKTADKMSTYADQAARNMQSHFADYLFDPFAEGTRGMVDGFSQAIRRMLAEAAAAKLFEMVGGAMAGYGGQGTWGNIVRGIGGSMSQGAGKAGGGHVRPNSMQPVAEHGPELLQVGGQTMLMMGAAGGLVSPLMNKAGGGAGAGANSGVRVEVINNGAPVQAQASAQRQPDGTQLIRLVLSAVRDDISSGGGTLAAIKGRLDVRDRI